MGVIQIISWVLAAIALIFGLYGLVVVAQVYGGKNKPSTKKRDEVKNEQKDSIEP